MPVDFRRLRAELEDLQMARIAQHSLRRSIAAAVRRRLLADSGLSEETVVFSEIAEPYPSRNGLPPSDSFQLTLSLPGIVDDSFKARLDVSDPKHESPPWPGEQPAHVVSYGTTSFKILDSAESPAEDAHRLSAAISEKIQQEARDHFRSEALAKKGLLDPPPAHYLDGFEEEDEA